MKISSFADPRRQQRQNFNNDFYMMDYSNDFSQNNVQNDFGSHNYGQPQQQGFSSPFPQNSGGFGQPQPQQQMQGGGFGGFDMQNANQQFLVAAGQQLLSNPMTAAALGAVSQKLTDNSKSWIGSIKSYFAVDTTYVMKKIMLIFLPFLHKEWCIRYSSENVLPKDEPNLPDLYIPSMAFITYCLLSGYILGLQNKFAPDQIGSYAGTALAWLILEVVVISVAKYLLSTSSSLLGLLSLIAFGGYKFVW